MMTTHHSPLQRTGPALFVVGLHVVAIYVLSISMGWVRAPFVPKDVTVITVPDTQQEVKPEPVIEKPKLENEIIPEKDITVPQVEIQVPEDPAQNAPVADAAPAVPTGGESRPLHATSRVDPIYPPSERRASHEGVVRLQVQVDESGRVLDVQITKSSGFPALDQSATDAVKRWRFSPKMENGQAMGTVGSVAVTFQLK
jgi:protein TonB